jgi:hypothetical protein
MKRFISILLVAVMLVAMIPAGIFTASAAEATLPTQTWIEAGKYDLSWAADLITTTIFPRGEISSIILSLRSIAITNGSQTLKISTPIIYIGRLTT